MTKTNTQFNTGTLDFGGFSYENTNALFSGLDDWEANQINSASTAGTLDYDTAQDFVSSVLKEKGLSDIDISTVFSDDDGQITSEEFEEILKEIENIFGSEKDIFETVENKGSDTEKPKLVDGGIAAKAAEAFIKENLLKRGVPQDAVEKLDVLSLINNAAKLNQQQQSPDTSDFAEDAITEEQLLQILKRVEDTLPSEDKPKKATPDLF